MRAVLLAVCGALVLAAPAAGGGTATAGLAPPPDDLGAGQTWRAEVTILQHGVTPLVGVEPAVIVTNGKVTRRFAAEPTGKAGVYVAEVRFPSNGTWQYRVYDGFTEYGHAQTHAFAPVEIGPGGGSGLALPDWAWALVAAAGALAAVLLVARRLRSPQAPVAHQP